VSGGEAAAKTDRQLSEINIYGYNAHMHLMKKCRRRFVMGDKGGKKDKEKSQKQKGRKHAHEVQAKKDKQPKSMLK
jgi:hypothetical protein